MSKLTVPIQALRDRGIEVLPRGGGGVIDLPKETRIEAPSSLKWTAYEHSLHLGAFSYQVSGYCFGARIGRYCSFGEDVQIGRQNHPLTWASTSPAFYVHDRLFDLGKGFAGAEDYHHYRFRNSAPPTIVKITTIGHDVWIGHGALVRAGVTIGDGAIVGAHSVVVKDVPPYSVVAGNPAEIKRFRVPPHLISTLMRVRWWRFAPWQLAHLDAANLKAFLAGVQAMSDVEPFAPTVTDLSAGHL